MKKILLVLVYSFSVLFTLNALEIEQKAFINPDGVLDEWAGIPEIRYSTAGDSSSPLQWKGLEDLSATIRLAWYQDTLYISGKVYDESRKADDKIEIGIAAREKRWILSNKTLYLKSESVPDGKTQQMVFGEFQVKNAASGNNGSREKVCSVVKEFPGFYIFEIAVPLQMIPDFVSPEQSAVYFQLRINDGDAGRVYPQRLDRLKNMTPFKLVEKRTDIRNDLEQNVKFYTTVNVPDPVLSNEIPCRIELANHLLTESSTVTLKLQDLEQVFNKSDFRQEDGYFYVESQLNLKDIPEGTYDLHLTLAPDQQKKDQCYTLDRPLTVLHKTVNVLLPETLDHLEKVNLSKLSRKKPFKASAYFSVVSTVEWLKWGIMQKSKHAVTEAAAEIRARLAAIEGKKLPREGVYSLLELTRNPEAQLVVEYCRERTPLDPYMGSISIHYGNLDLVSCMFYEDRSEKKRAAARLEKMKKSKYAEIFELNGVEICNIPQTVKEKDGTVLVSPVTGTFFFEQKGIFFELPYVSRDAALKFAGILLKGKPCTVKQREAIRQDMIKVTGRTPRPLVLPEGIEVFCGDNHSHSFLSDGRPTPLTVTAEAIYIGLDYHILTDHGVYEGALNYQEDTLKKHGLAYPTGVGVEVNSRWGHVNIYPMQKGNTYSLGPTFKDVVAAAHAIDGAVIQWNHPDTSYSNLPEYLENGIEGSGLHAWEHYPPHYTQWKKEGKLPVLTGGTDTHNGTFHMPERSLMFIPSASCKDIADGVRKNSIVMVDPWNGAYTITRDMVNKSRWDSDLYFYGSDPMIQLAVDVLADDDYLLDLKKKRIAGYFENLDVKGLIHSSDAYETVK